MNKKTLWAVIAFVIVAGAAYRLAIFRPSSTPTTNTGIVAGAATVEPSAQTETAELIVYGLDGELYRGNLTVTAGASVLTLMQNAGLTLGTKEYSFGTAIESINGVDQKDADGKYWAFYVNGALAQEGASTLVAKAGDRIEWKLE